MVKPVIMSHNSKSGSWKGVLNMAEENGKILNKWVYILIVLMAIVYGMVAYLIAIS